MTQKKRIAWIDNTRMFAMICVITTHIISALHTPGISNYVNWIVSFNMPLFIFLSGYMALGGFRKIENIKDWYSFLYKITARIAVPTVVCGYLSLAILRFWEGNTIKTCGYTIIAAAFIILYLIYKRCKCCKRILAPFFLMTLPLAYKSGHWFMWMLIIEMIIFSFIELAYKKSRIGTYIIVMILFLLLYICPITINAVEFYPYFLIGLLAQKYNIINKLSVFKIFIVLLSALLGISLYFYLGDYCYFYNYKLPTLIKTGHFYLWPLRIVCGIAWSIFFIYSFMALSKSYSFFSYCGTLTLGLYLLHIPILNTLIFYNIQLPITNTYYIIASSVISISILLLVIFAAILLKKIKIAEDLIHGSFRI